jgi:predicted transcriptional regulator
MLSTERESSARFQQKLRGLGYSHSQQTIVEEYINPLINVGLAQNSHDRFQTTVLGCRLNELVKDCRDIGDVLPPHSECYEEVVLEMLLEKPRTHEDFNGAIQPKSVNRVLKRLEVAGLIETPREKDYVFFFKTKRNSEKEEFSPTEEKVYENISMDGISAHKLAEKTGISLRRTYKYLRRLKGKKLVFAKERRISYKLTPDGFRIAKTLKDVLRLIAEASKAAQLIEDLENRQLLVPGTLRYDNGKSGTIPLSFNEFVKSK